MKTKTPPQRPSINDDNETWRDYHIATTGKRKRMRYAKSEVWMIAAMWADDHARDLEGKPRRPGERPSVPFDDAFIARYPDDPIVDIIVRYGLTPADIARIFRQLGSELETRAVACGFEESGEHGWRP